MELYLNIGGNSGSFSILIVSMDNEQLCDYLTTTLEQSPFHSLSSAFFSLYIMDVMLPNKTFSCWVGFTLIDDTSLPLIRHTRVKHKGKTAISVIAIHGNVCFRTIKTKILVKCHTVVLPFKRTDVSVVPNWARCCHFPKLLSSWRQ